MDKKPDMNLPPPVLWPECITLRMSGSHSRIRNEHFVQFVFKTIEHVKLSGLNDDDDDDDDDDWSFTATFAHTVG